jgi:hypothetical protein
MGKDMENCVGVILGGISSGRRFLSNGRNVHDNLDRDQARPDLHGGRDGSILSWQLISQNTTTDITERLEKEARRISYEAQEESISPSSLSTENTERTAASRGSWSSSESPTPAPASSPRHSAWTSISSR